MKEPDEWEKRNIVYYFKHLFLQKHKRILFEESFKFDFTHEFPTLDIDVKSKRRTDFADIAVEHKVLTIHYHFKKSDNDFFYYSLSIRGIESINALLNGTRLLILQILNEHCLHNQMRPWNKAPALTGNKEIYFYISQVPPPTQETEAEKLQRRTLITVAGTKIWRFLTGEPINNSVNTCDKSLVDGSLSREHVNGTGLVLILKQPNLEKLNTLAIKALQEKQKRLSPRPPSPEVKLHYSVDEEEQKHALISNKPPKVHHFTKSPNTPMFKPPSPPIKKPDPPSIKTPSLKTPDVPLAKTPSTVVMQPLAPPNALFKRPIPQQAPTVTQAKASVSSQTSTTAKRPYSLLDMPVKEKPHFLVKIDEFLDEHKEKKARELKLQNRGEDEKSSVLQFTGKQIPK